MEEKATAVKEGKSSHDHLSSRYALRKLLSVATMAQLIPDESIPDCVAYKERRFWRELKRGLKQDKTRPSKAKMR